MRSAVEVPNLDMTARPRRPQWHGACQYPREKMAPERASHSLAIAVWSG